jgi:hypothetical protein
MRCCHCIIDDGDDDDDDDTAMTMTAPKRDF